MKTASDIMEVMMRWFATLAVLAATPAFAEAPHCAIPGATEMAQAATPSVKARPIPAVATPAAAPAAQPVAHPIPESLAGLPFLQHVAASGATLFDLGVSHGLHLAAARSGDEFRLFSVLPNGKAAIEGAPVELGVAQLSTIASGNITQLGQKAGFDGYFVRSGQQFQVFYATQDNSIIVPGILRDAQGRNLTRDQIAKIPGVVPTVDVSVGSGPSATAVEPSAEPSPAGLAAQLAAVQKSDYGSIGPASAPQLFMLIDPQCIYSVRSYQELRGYAQAGKIRLSVVPLSVLDYEDHGQSTKSALALLSKPTDQLLAAWQSGDVAGPLAPDAPNKLRQNMAIAEAFVLKGTPTFIWRKTDGSVGRIDGVPSDIGALVSSVGS